MISQDKPKKQFMITISFLVQKDEVKDIWNQENGRD